MAQAPIPAGLYAAAEKRQDVFSVTFRITAHVGRTLGAIKGYRQMKGILGVCQVGVWDL